MSNNKRAHKQLSDALEIDPDTETGVEEEEDNAAELMARLSKFKEMKEDAKKAAAENDNDFIKETLRELALMGLHAGRVLEDEIEVNAKGRDVECLAGIMNATRDALKKLQDVDLDDKKMTIEEKKLAIRQSSNGKPNLTQNNMFVGSHNDMLKAMRDIKKLDESNENNIIDVESENIDAD